jgi:hypothetical protein
MSICRLLFQRTSTIKKNPSKRVGLLQSGPHQQLIENLFFLVMIYSMWPKALPHVKKKSLYNQPKPDFFKKLL